MAPEPVFRARVYRVDPSRLPAFTEFFLTYLLPVQERHGARLVGRWSSVNGERVVAVWMYVSQEEAQRIQDAVRDDPQGEQARAVREASEPFYLSYEEMMLSSTVDMSRTLLGPARPGSAEA